MLDFTEKAREKVHFYMKGKDLAEWGVRIVVKGRGDYAFSLVELKNATPTDEVVAVDDFRVVVDDISARYLQGATVDFIEDDVTQGFAVKHPQPAQPQGGNLDLNDPTTKKVYDILQNEINPGIAAHGGVARLVGVKDNVVYLQFGGGCHGCGMVDVTLKQGIEARIKELIPEIKQVADATDHSTGTNPYFQASR